MLCGQGTLAMSVGGTVTVAMVSSWSGKVMLGEAGTGQVYS